MPGIDDMIGKPKKKVTRKKQAVRKSEELPPLSHEVKPKRKFVNELPKEKEQPKPQPIQEATKPEPKKEFPVKDTSKVFMARFKKPVLFNGRQANSACIEKMGSSSIAEMHFDGNCLQMKEPKSGKIIMVPTANILQMTPK